MRYRRSRRQRAAVSRSWICLLGVGFSLCKVVFALGQAKFCVLATFIRIARLFGHFSQGNWLLSLFSYVVFKRMQKICEISPWLVAFERTCSYQFSLWETFKKKTDHSHRHLGFLVFSGSISPINPCHCKWLSNVIFLKCWWTPGEAAYFFLAKASHAALLQTAQTKKKKNPQWQVPKCMRYRRCGKQIHDLLTGGGFLLAPGCFCASSLFLSGLRHDFGTCFNYSLATLRLQEQNNVFSDGMPFIHKVLMVVWMGPHVDMHFRGSAHHDEISCMFTRWGHELDWGVVYNYMSM